MEGFTVGSAVTAAFAVVTPAIDFIVSNPIMIVYVGASLIPIGFMIFRKGKKAAK